MAQRQRGHVGEKGLERSAGALRMLMSAMAILTFMSCTSNLAGHICH